MDENAETEIRRNIVVGEANLAGNLQEIKSKLSNNAVGDIEKAICCFQNIMKIMDSITR